MLKVNIKKEDNDATEVYAGQIRYNASGMYVLITVDSGLFDAIVLTGGFHSKPFGWNSKGQTPSSIASVYPFVANGVLEIWK